MFFVYLATVLSSGTWVALLKSYWDLSRKAMHWVMNVSDSGQGQISRPKAAFRSCTRAVHQICSRIFMGLLPSEQPCSRQTPVYKHWSMGQCLWPRTETSATNTWRGPFIYAITYSYMYQHCETQRKTHGWVLILSPRA